MRRQFLLACGSLAACACSAAPVPLRYMPNDYTKDPEQSQVKVGVYLPQDSRPGFRADVAAREQRLLIAELPITFASDLKSDGPIDEYIRSALSKELDSHGLKVSHVGGFREAPNFEQVLRKPTLLVSPGLDYAVFARINHQSWYHPGFAGLLFQGSMPPGVAYCDFDIGVVNANTGHVVWLGEASNKVTTTETSAPEPEEIGGYIAECASKALAEVMNQGALLGALRPTPALPSPATPTLPTPTPAAVSFPPTRSSSEPAY